MAFKLVYFWRKRRIKNAWTSKSKVLGVENVINITAVMILVIALIIFKYGSLQLMLVANKLGFHGLPIINCNLTNMSCRLPYLKIMSDMTKIITTVMLITFSMPRTLLFDVQSIFDPPFSPEVDECEGP